MGAPGERHRKGQKCECSFRDRHIFPGGLGRTRAALYGVSQQEMNASPATVP